MAHLGYLQWLSAFLRWSNSLWRSSGLLHTVLALWVRVLITLYLADKWRWLSHCRYWSMWVGFLYTVMYSVLSASGLTMVSKKGVAPFSLLSSTVKIMAGSTLLMCYRKCCLYPSFWMTNMSCTYLSHSLGGKWQYFEIFAQSIPCRGKPPWGWLGCHCSSLNLFIEFALEGKICIMQAEL